MLQDNGAGTSSRAGHAAVQNSTVITIQRRAKKNTQDLLLTGAMRVQKQERESKRRTRTPDVDPAA